MFKRYFAGLLSLLLLAGCGGENTSMALDPDPVVDPETEVALLQGSASQPTTTITGTVEEIPENDQRVGLWVVNGERIWVSRLTIQTTRDSTNIGESVQIEGFQLNSGIFLAYSVRRIDPDSSLFARRLVSGLDNPLYVTAPPGDTDRLFIVEQNSGQIKIFDLNTNRLRRMPFLAIPQGELLRAGFEQGLLGLAFPSDYESSGKFYVNYTAPGVGNAGQTKLVEYRVSGNPNRAIASSGRLLLSIPQPAQNHNGGWIGFGPDGYLYWATGDGGGSGFLPGIPSFADNSRDITDNLLGKILRLDVSGGDDFPSDTDRNYRIPSNNPFGGQDGDDEIWVYGLRNPWRASFDRETGDLYIADVGQDSREEVNIQLAGSLGGEHYGWNIREGTRVLQPDLDSPELVDPFYEYDHSVGQSITGGYVYRGSNPVFNGTYFFGDFTSGRIWSFKFRGSGVVTERTNEFQVDQGSIDQIASFGEDAAGNLYIVDLDGEIFRIEFPENDI
jgi:glucose/arabinose dehydrogenase